jgi:alginate O-acetyltransferase complex protein AlgI
MLFSSLVFLFFFLPLLLVAYYCVPRNWRNSILLLFSLLFYAWGGVSYSIILILSIVVNFIIVKQLSKCKPNKKRWLVVGVVFNLVLLISFKYLNFVIENINDVYGYFGGANDLFPALKILLPLGISFFTFQQMSMLVDVYRIPEKNNIAFFETALYISFFPQLVAGPIVRFKDIINQIRSRRETLSVFNSGIERFIIGLFKKIIIANTCGFLVDTILKNDISSLSSSAAWLAIVAYALQIYFDFSGYSDMAIGLGRMFGFNIAENFNFPYAAKSMKEFWQRWHISLSTWFRDYVYIPLGGNRVTSIRLYGNLMVVFLLTGFWHGATWSFVFWGCYHGCFLILERNGLGKILERLPFFVSWGYTILVVLIGWVFFRIEDFSLALVFIQTLFGFGIDGDIQAFEFLNNEYLFVLVLALLISYPLIKAKLNISEGLLFAKNIGLVLIFIYSVMSINSGSYNPFIYFRF